LYINSENTLYIDINHSLPSLITAIYITASTKYSSLWDTTSLEVMLNQAGTTVYSNYAGSSIASDRVTEVGEVQQRRQKKCPKIRVYGELLRHKPTSLGQHTPKSKTCQK
jgi:hypothetical protein